MKEHSGLFIIIPVILFLLPVLVHAGDISGPASSVPDPWISAQSFNPALTTTPPSVIINPRVVVRTTVIPQATGVLILESVPANASVYVEAP